MTHYFDIRLDITWRDILTRILLVIAAVTIIVWFMPRDQRLFQDRER